MDRYLDHRFTKQVSRRATGIAKVFTAEGRGTYYVYASFSFAPRPPLRAGVRILGL